METNPHLGNAEFAGSPKNVGEAPGTFKFKVSLNGVDQGWVGKAGSQNMWARVVKSEGDAVLFEWYSYNNVGYLRNPGTCYKWMVTWSNGLAGKPVAFNTWDYANGWKLEGGHLVAVDKKEPVSLYNTDDPWLYVNKDYKVLDFTLVKAG